MKIVMKIVLLMLCVVVSSAFAQVGTYTQTQPKGVVRGSATVQSKILSNTSSSPGSIRSGGGSGTQAAGYGGQGFGCAVGEWGIQDGIIKCVTSTLPIISDIGSKAIYVKMSLPSPANPSVVMLMRLTGSVGSRDVNTSIRVDLFDAEGGVAKASAPCFISAPNIPCNMGSATGPGSAAQLNTNPMLPDGSGTLRFADYLLLTASSVLGVGDIGAQYSDSYYVTTIVMDEAGNLNVYAAGMFAKTDSASTQKLLGPIVGKGQLTTSYIGSAPDQAIYPLDGWLKK